MRVGVKSRRVGDLVHGVAKRLFEPGVGRDVLDHATHRTDEVMVVTDEVLGELEAGELVVGDDAVHHAGFDEDHKVAVHAALGQPVSSLEHFRDGERTRRCGEDVDDRLAVRCQPLVDAMQP
jgi:hypothetical protein